MKVETHYTRHGGPWDRGSADSYYGRPRNPHYFLDASYSSPRVAMESMTEGEIAAYNAGYTDNELYGEKKSWD